MLMPVADSADTVLSPAIGVRASLIVRKIIPRVAVWAIILTDRPPLAFGKIRTPSLPVSLSRRGRSKPLVFLGDQSLPLFVRSLSGGLVGSQVVSRPFLGNHLLAIVPRGFVF